MNLGGNAEVKSFRPMYIGEMAFFVRRICMIDKIKDMNNQIFIVSMIDYNSKNEFSQFSKDIAKHIMDNYKLIDEKYGFKVYYKE